jgi:CHAT domain-containing protein
LRRLLTLKLAIVPAEGEPVRRQTRREECTEAEWSLASRLADHPYRLVVMSEREPDKCIVAEVAHEAFLRAWPRLAQWLREERAFLVFKGEAERAERRWREMKLADKALLTGLDLARAEEWLPKRSEDLSTEVTAYVQRSIAFDRAVKERQLRFQRRVTVGAVAAALLMAVIGGFAWLQWSEAERAKTDLALQTSQLSVAAEGYRSQIAADRDRAAGQLDRALSEAAAAKQVFADLVHSAPNVLVWQTDLDKAIDEGLNVMQRASQTAAGQALNALAMRLSASNDVLARLIRRDQDLTAEASDLDKAIIAAVSNEPSKRDAAAEQRIRDRIAAITKERDNLHTAFTRDFPEYAALSNPQPLTVKEIQALLADDEALIVIDLGDKSYVWAITRSAADWKELALSAADISKRVSELRSLLKVYRGEPFDPQACFELYQKLLGPVEDVLPGKARLSFVLTGALTGLSPQVLVTRDPAGKALKDVDWLLRTHAITVLPSVASIKVLRIKPTVAEATKPLIGFAAPTLLHEQQGSQTTVNVGDTSGRAADIESLTSQWVPLPDTADELRKVAASVHADPADVILGPDATVTRVKQAKLDEYRIVYFATYSLADESALVLSLPEHPTKFDDGLLTASEVAQLRLNADWVVLSADNTAAGDKPGGEALSGLARAFFYAGARSVVVSNWEVESKSTTALMTGTFAALAADPRLSHGEALQKSMLAMLNDAQHPEWAEPKYWAPFVVVGEPPKPVQRPAVRR